MPLNPKQERFVRAYLSNGGNATQAAVKAGYSVATAAAQGSRLLKHVEVKAALAVSGAKAAAAADLDAARVLGEVAHLAHSDLLDAFNKCPGNLDCTADKHYCDRGTLRALESMPEGLRRAIASIEFTELFEGSSGEKFVAGRIVKIKLWDKPKALEMEGRHLKLFTDKLEVKGTFTLEELIDQAVARGKGEEK